MCNFRVIFGCSLSFLALVALAGCNSPENRVKAYYQHGLELMGQGEPAKAGVEFRNALKIKEDYIPALYSLGEVEEQQGKYESAVRLFGAVAERAADHVQSRVHLAYIFAAAGQLDNAQKFVDEAYNLAKSDPKVLATKAAIALKLDNRGDAVRFSNEALKTDPANSDALIVLAAERLLSSDAKGALAFLDRADEKSQHNVGLQFFRMQAFQALGDKSGVEQVYLKLIAFYPKEEKFHDELARWYVSVARRDDAEKLLRQYATDNPDSVRAELNLVALVKGSKGPDAAKAELSQRIQKGGAVLPYKLALAQLTFEIGDYPGATDQMKRLIAETKDKADNISARIGLARMMLARDDRSEAEKLVESVLTDDVQNADALALRASIRLNAGRTSDAIEDLRAALNQAPQSPSILALLADAYDRSGSAQLADEQYAKAMVLAGTSIPTRIKYAQFLLRYGRQDQAEKVLTDTRQRAPENEQVLTLLAGLKLKRQDWVGAQEIADALRSRGTKGDIGLAGLISSAALGAQAKFDESARVLQSLVDGAQSRNSLPLAALVQTYLAAGKPDKAQELLTSLLKSQPENVQANILLASLYESTKRFDDAEASYQSALKADKDGITGSGSFAQFLIRRNRLPEAEKLLREALNKHNDEPSLRMLLATELELSRQYDAAIAEYEKLFEADPRSTMVANNLASLLSDYRSDDASLDRAYEIASRFRNSDVPQFLDTLGWIYERKGKYDDALPLLKSAAEKMPNVEMVQYHLGMVYKDLGQNDLAVAALKRALSISQEQGGSPPGVKAKAALDQLVSAEPAPQKAN